MNKEPRESKEDQESTWAHDQEKHSYYYDDAHGYEVYNPDDEMDENDEDETNEKEREL